MLRTVKLLTLAAMLFVALTAGAQVATSALLGVVPAERGAAVVLNTPADAKNNTMSNMDGRSAIESHGLLSSNEIHLEELIEDGSIKEMLGPLLVGLFALLVVSCVFITAILKGKNIKIKCSDIDITIDDSKKEKEE